jgi:hypothetical protein
MISGILIRYIFQFCTGKKTKFDFNCQTTFAAVLLMNKAFQTNLLTVSCLSFHQSETKNQNKKMCLFVAVTIPKKKRHHGLFSFQIVRTTKRFWPFHF